MVWKYIISTGELFSPDGNRIGVGYSGGALGTRPEAKNNPEYCHEKGVGPIPAGKYEFGTPIEHSHLGPFVLPLIPDAKNTMYGRSGFYMHGDKIGSPGDASEGCIIMPRNGRNACANSEDQGLEVVA